jgi:hypothetical protein
MNTRKKSFLMDDISGYPKFVSRGAVAENSLISMRVT